jgi:phosphoribosylamine--glycine ligase
LDTVKVLVIGPGGREHAIVRSLLADPNVSEVHAAPGNAGISKLVPTYDINGNDPQAVAELALRLAVDLVVVGPEAPLAAGVSDAVREAGIPVFGPSKAAAQLEASKAFAKEVMAEAGVPTAMAMVATNAGEAESALDTFGAPYVVKDDGLAAGNQEPRRSLGACPVLLRRRRLGGHRGVPGRPRSFPVCPLRWAEHRGTLARPGFQAHL